MGTAYTKTSPTNFVDGETINASDFTTEFDAIDATFETGGHQHDGTDGEGGAIEKLLSNTITFGTGVDTDIAVTFNANTADGVLTWMEDEDYFKFSDDILVNSDEKLYFRDTAIYLNSSTDGQLDIVADTEIQIAATTIDINGNVDISGTVTIGSAEISEAELEILDGATATTAELNIVDGDTSATSTTVADADRVVLNDNGTMVQVAVTDLAAYFDDEITAMPNLVTTATTTVGALNSGSITSGFGTIDTGSSTITTTGLISGGSLDIDDVLINGTTIGHTDDTDLITLTDGVVTVAGELDAATLDISGNADIDGTTNLDAVDIDGAVQIDGATTFGVDDTGVDVKLFGATSGAYLLWDESADKLLTAGGTVVDIVKDKLLIGGTAVTTTAAELNVLDAVTAGTVTASLGVVVDSNKDIGTFRNITLSGELDAGSLDVSGDADIDGTLEADAITVGGTALNTVIAGVTVANATLAATTTVSDSTANTNFPVVFHDESNALLDDTGALRYNPSTGELLVPKLTVAGTTTQADTVTMQAENAVVFEGATADAHETTLTIVDPTADRTINLPNQSGTIPVLAAASNTAITSTPAEINLIDGGTSRGTTAVASGDGILINDAGTMRMTNVDTVSTYFSSHNVGGGNIVTTGALNSGSITSGFGTIDTGSSAITTTGLISGGSLDIDDVLINGTTIGHTDDTDLITLADGVVTVAGELDAATLDISGNADIDGTTNLDTVDIVGAVQLDGTLSDGVDDTGYDVKFCGATAGRYMLWDESADSLIFPDNAKPVCGYSSD